MTEETFISLNKLLIDVQNHLSKLRSERVSVEKESMQDLIYHLRKFINDNPLEDIHQPEIEVEYMDFETKSNPPPTLVRKKPSDFQLNPKPSPILPKQNQLNLIQSMNEKRQISELCLKTQISQECIGKPLRERQLIDKKIKGLLVKKERICSINRITGWNDFDFLAFIVKKGKDILLNIPLTEWKCETRDNYLIFNYNNIDYEFEDKTSSHAKDWVEFANKIRNQQDNSTSPSTSTSTPVTTPKTPERMKRNDHLNKIIKMRMVDETPPTIPTRKHKPKQIQQSDECFYNDVEYEMENEDEEYEDVENSIPPQFRRQISNQNTHQRVQSEYLNDNIFTTSNDHHDDTIYHDTDTPVYETMDYLDRYLCLYDTTTISNDEILKVKPGSTVQFQERISNEYFYGKYNDKFGVVPFVYVQKVYGNYTSLSLDHDNYEN